MKRSGFTLLEVLVAVAILVGGVIVVSTAWSGNTLRMRKATLYNNVAQLLERKMVEIETEFKGKPLEEIVDQEGDFGSDLPQYRWTFKTHEFQMPDLSAILLGKDAAKEETFIQMIRMVQEFISKSIKEGVVTVFVKSGKNEVPFTVSTYFVNYDQELSIPGLPGGGGGGAPPTDPGKKTN